MTEAEIQPDVAVSAPSAKRFSLVEFIASLRTLVRANQLAFVSASVAIGVVLVAGLSTVTVSQQPGFCVNCHEIRPAFDQWRTSSHYGVTCVQCHTEPGLAGILKINVVGARHLVTHLVSDYRVPAEADVRDSSCLSCHPRDSRPELIPSITLRVAHSKHDKQQCSECHGRLVHVNGAGEISAAPKPHEVRDCTVCHTPEKLNPHGYATLDCTSCHSGIIPKHEDARLRGVMPRASCQECHARAKVGSAEYCQTCHVSPHGIAVACSRCHTSNTTWTEHAFNHPVPLSGRHTQVDCAKCHAKRQAVSVKAEGPAKLVCSECHSPPALHKGTTGDCTTCHSQEGFKPAKIANHKFPQNHGTAASDCTKCHPQGNTQVVACTTCHETKSLEAKHPALGSTNIAKMCVTCHPAGKKP